MLLIGSDDGVYRVTIHDESEVAEATKIFDTGRVMRLRQFDGIESIFAATKTGLYRSIDGKQWENMDVPEEKVYAVGVNPTDRRLYVGTRPAHIYVTESIETSETTTVEWNELNEFQELPSREEWRLPRHENLAQVRDIHNDTGGTNRVVAGVEVGGSTLVMTAGIHGSNQPTVSTMIFTNSMWPAPENTSLPRDADYIGRTTLAGRGDE